jgi:hypothetical protein
MASAIAGEVTGRLRQTIAGTPRSSGAQDGIGPAAQFFSPRGIASAC